MLKKRTYDINRSKEFENAIKIENPNMEEELELIEGCTDELIGLMCNYNRAIQGLVGTPALIEDAPESFTRKESNGLIEDLKLTRITLQAICKDFRTLNLKLNNALGIKAKNQKTSGKNDLTEI